MIDKNNEISTNTSKKTIEENLRSHKVLTPKKPAPYFIVGTGLFVYCTFCSRANSLEESIQL